MKQYSPLFRKYHSALDFHHRALILRPQNPSTLSAMGFTYALMGEHENAVDYLHQALGLRRDDTFSTTMLTYAIEQHMAEAEPCEGQK